MSSSNYFLYILSISLWNQELENFKKGKNTYEIHKTIGKLILRQKRADVNQWFSKCGPWTSCICVAQEFVRVGSSNLL